MAKKYVVRDCSPHHYVTALPSQSKTSALQGLLRVKTVVFVLLCLLLIGLTIRLGFWQLARANYHQQLIEQYNALALEPPLELRDGVLIKNYQRVLVQGEWLDKQVLVDSQVHQGQRGYQVLQLFQPENGAALWVDRGFIAASRSELPDIKMPAEQRLQLGYYDAVNWQRKRVHIEQLQASLWRLSAYNAPELASIAGQQVGSGVFRVLNAGDAQLIPNWQVAAVKPEKNIAYAVQWFALALVLLLAMTIYLWHNIKDNNKEFADGDGC